MDRSHDDFELGELTACWNSGRPSRPHLTIIVSARGTVILLSREQTDRNRVRIAGRRHGGPGGSENFEHGGWSFKFERGDQGDQFKLNETLQSDALLLGRVTYQGFAEA
jgi:hypothetical protein